MSKIVTFICDLGARVKIIDLDDLKGVVDSLRLVDTGKQYYVNYWHECRRYSEVA